MAELYLMASHGYPPGMTNKDFQPIPITTGGQLEILRSRSSAVNHNQMEPFSSLMIEAKPCLKMESVIMDVPGRMTCRMACSDDNLCQFSIFEAFCGLIQQNACFPSFPLGGGINEHSMSHREAFQFVNSGSNDVHKGGLGIPMMADLVGLHLKENELTQPSYVPSLAYPGSYDKPISDFIGDLTHNSNVVIDPFGRVLVTDTGIKMKDLLSIITEFYLLKGPISRRMVSMPIPYFDRKSFRKGRSNTNGSGGKLEAAGVTPAKSSDTSKLKQSQKRRHVRKVDEERDLFKRNYFHSCESLLTILIDRKGKGQATLLSLKKSGRELPDLLNKFSAGIAGTGLALVLSVVCKVACGKVPFCSAKLVSTGLGLGLVWLSWAVNKLRDTVIDIIRNASKLGMKEDDVMDKVDRSVKEIYFRAAILMALVVLRFV